MKTEDKYTPACVLIDKFGDKWSLAILILLSQNDKMRFTELQKTIPSISQRMLTITLRTLESLNLVHREYYSQIPPKVEYSLTDLGIDLIPHIQNLIQWAKDNEPELTKNWEK